MWRKLKYVLVVGCAVLAFFLLIPATRDILLAVVMGDPLASDLRPASYHAKRLVNEQPEITIDSLRQLLTSEECAVKAAPQLLIYFQELRKRGKELAIGTLKKTADTIEKSSKESVNNLAAVLGEMLLCEGDDGTDGLVARRTILQRAVWADARHESITLACVKLLWSRFVISIDSAAWALNHFEKTRLKDELLKMSRSQDEFKPDTARELMAKYFPRDE